MIDEESFFGFEGRVSDAAEAKVKHILTEKMECMTFSYDYGDGWEIELVLEEVDADKELPGKELPRIYKDAYEDGLEPTKQSMYLLTREYKKITLRGAFKMIEPEKVQLLAKKKERENLEFRTFLKINTNEEELDRQFSELHDELFADYDCSKCRNCCKLYPGGIPAAEVEKDAGYLHMKREEFIERYLENSGEEGLYQTIHTPCDFLQADGGCKLGSCKPDNCKNYPYTNQPGRLWCLYSVLDAVEVCPVAFEIYERLKKLYGFHQKR